VPVWLTGIQVFEVAIDHKEFIMARLVKRFRKLPYALTVGGETLSICGCGLSATLPLCDGTHKITASEEPDKLDWYDDAGERHVAIDSFGHIRSDKQMQTA
jgi:CDGSH-type Zn-finger protein